MLVLYVKFPAGLASTEASSSFCICSKKFFSVKFFSKDSCFTLAKTASFKCVVNSRTTCTEVSPYFRFQTLLLFLDIFLEEPTTSLLADSTIFSLL